MRVTFPSSSRLLRSLRMVTSETSSCLARELTLQKPSACRSSSILFRRACVFIDKVSDSYFLTFLIRLTEPAILSDTDGLDAQEIAYLFEQATHCTSAQ